MSLETRPLSMKVIVQAPRNAEQLPFLISCVLITLEM